MAKKKLTAEERNTNHNNRKSKVHPKTAKALGNRLPDKKKK